MNIEDIAIATITLARTEDEENLLKKSLSTLASLNIPVFITDGGSSTPFIDFLHSFPQFYVSDKIMKGIWAQARSSLVMAKQSKTPFILYSEPDKHAFFESSLKDVITNSAFNDQTGIVVCSRSQKSFSSFPEFQQITETAINQACKQITSKQFEFTYGPFLLNNELIPHLEKLSIETGWGWRTFAFGITSRLGYEITSYQGDFFCPEDQQKDDHKDRIYRLKQLKENIEGLLLSHSFDLGDLTPLSRP